MELRTLPDDVDELKSIILSYHNQITSSQTEFLSLKKDIAISQTEVLSLKKDIASLTEKNHYLEEQVKLLTLFRFARKSERWTEEDEKQSLLFDEAESNATENKEPEADEIEVIKSYSRKKRGRRKINPDLPREEVIHDLSDAQKQCACGHTKSHIGDDTSEEIEVIPAQFKIIRHIYRKYVCKGCDGLSEEGKGAVQSAQRPKKMLEKTMTTSGLLAYLFAGKFEYGLPYFRQEKFFGRMGIYLPRADMCNWQIGVHEKLSPLLDLLIEEIKASPLIAIDETTIQVLREPNRDDTSKSYMWVYRGGTRDKPLLLYEYHPTRSGKIPVIFLNNYKGIILTDGYPGYNELGRRAEIIWAGCWGHSRRKFIEAKKLARKESEADKILRLIRQLYLLERIWKKKSYKEIQESRQQYSKPVVEEIKQWLDVMVLKIPPRCKLGEAIQYTLNEWQKLIIFLDHGIVPLDNNLVENAIRPFVVGRKNWLFSGSPRGAKASAALYSLIETAKANGFDPYWYLRFLFNRLPYAESREEIRKLLPNHLTIEEMNAYKAKMA